MLGILCQVCERFAIPQWLSRAQRKEGVAGGDSNEREGGGVIRDCGSRLNLPWVWELSGIWYGEDGDNGWREDGVV